MIIIGRKLNHESTHLSSEYAPGLGSQTMAALDYPLPSHLPRSGDILTFSLLKSEPVVKVNACLMSRFQKNSSIQKSLVE